MNVNLNLTYQSNNCILSVTHYLKTMSHAIYQQLLCWMHSILCFLQVLYPIRNHRFNIYDFSCSITCKLREVKQHRYLQNPQLIFDTPTYSHNPFLTQCQSILLLTPLCMLTPISRHPRMSKENNKVKYKDHNHYEILICYS